MATILNLITKLINLEVKINTLVKLSNEVINRYAYFLEIKNYGVGVSKSLIFIGDFFFIKFSRAG